MFFFMFLTHHNVYVSLVDVVQGSAARARRYIRHARHSFSQEQSTRSKMSDSDSDEYDANIEFLMREADEKEYDDLTSDYADTDSETDTSDYEELSDTEENRQWVKKQALLGKRRRAAGAKKKAKKQSRSKRRKVTPKCMSCKQPLDDLDLPRRSCAGCTVRQFDFAAAV